MKPGRAGARPRHVPPAPGAGGRTPTIGAPGALPDPRAKRRVADPPPHPEAPGVLPPGVVATLRRDRHPAAPAWRQRSGPVTGRALPGGGVVDIQARSAAPLPRFLPGSPGQAREHGPRHRRRTAGARVPPGKQASAPWTATPRLPVTARPSRAARRGVSAPRDHCAKYTRHRHHGKSARHACRRPAAHLPRHRPSAPASQNHVGPFPSARFTSPPPAASSARCRHAPCA